MPDHLGDDMRKVKDSATDEKEEKEIKGMRKWHFKLFILIGIALPLFSSW
jgi:hypothetical protein